MTGPVVRHPMAYHDLDEIAALLQERSGPDLALQFLESAERIFDQLAKMPGIGTRYKAENPRLTGLRCASITGFKRYLIFYRPLDPGIEVLRVLHGARNIQSLLRIDLDIDDQA